MGIGKTGVVAGFGRKFGGKYGYLVLGYVEFEMFIGRSSEDTQAFG